MRELGGVRGYLGKKGVHGKCKDPEAGVKVTCRNRKQGGHCGWGREP